MPLGVILKNENKLDEMTDILHELHKYVAVVRRTETFQPAEGVADEPITCHIDHFSHTLIGGDQLTVARIRGCQNVQRNGESGRDRLEGLVPVIEDWHAKMCYMQVISSMGVMCKS